MDKTKILVTGGAGFIGSHLVISLSKAGHHITVLDTLRSGNKLANYQHPNIRLVEADTRDKNAVIKAAKDCKIIIHLAAVVGVDEVIEQPSEMIETETIGTANVVEAALQHKAEKLIYASSSAVYHTLESDLNREHDEPHLVNTYAIAKCLNERYLEAIAKSENISTNSLRLFNVYGKHQDNRMVIPRFFEKAMMKKSIEVFGTGQQTRDFTHVDDVTRAIAILSQRNDLDGVFNVAKGIETSILELANEIKKVTQSSSPIQLIEFPEKRIAYKVNRRIGCTEKLFAHTGFKPKITLTKGLSHLYKKLLKNSLVKAK